MVSPSRSFSFLALCVFAVLPVAGAVLFPTPLHLTRRIEDPVGGTTAVVEQYCYGNRMVSVRGTSTSIADFEKGELTQIDRESGTYSISRFEELARASASLPGARALLSASAEQRPRWNLRSVGLRSMAGREVEVLQGEIEPGSAEIEVSVDHRFELSKEAIEVLAGGAYPNQRSEESEFTLAAAAPAGSRSPLDQQNGHALPVEQIIRYQIDGERFEQRNTIVRIAEEIVPAELVAIPRGARLVESRTAKLQKQLEELDHLPSPPR